MFHLKALSLIIMPTMQKVGHAFQDMVVVSQEGSS